MISKMGIVTLFCNIAAAIGFGVFALTKSAILKEFGVVAGINIMLLFLISIILIPAILSYLPAPKERHTRYLTNTLADYPAGLAGNMGAPPQKNNFHQYPGHPGLFRCRHHPLAVRSFYSGRPA